MKLEEFKQRILPQLEVSLSAELASQLPHESSLYQAMNYSVEAGGKRIRPLLLLAIVETLKGDSTKGLLPATALEYIHTYSLIHDDLPAMDDDALRRGQPTNHIVYGEALAILAGDGLLTYAFELISKSDLLTNQQKVRLILALAKAAGPQGMVLGQVADMEGEQQQLPLAELQLVHQRKTGELLKFAAYAGAVIADVNEATEKSLLAFAAHLGLAFQIRDDILDVTGTTAELGKETGMDLVHQKSTYPSLLTLAGAKQALTAELNQAKEELVMLQKDSNLDISLLTGFIEMLEI